MDDHRDDEMTRWLERPDVQETLSGVARSVIRYALSKRLSPSFLRRDSDWGDVNDDFWEDVRSELVLFILENRLRIRKILFSGNKNSHLYLRRAFINYWIEKTRRPVRDPQRYLYKHAADVLRSSEDFDTFMGRNRSLMVGMAAEAVSIPPLSSEDIREIAFPDQMVGALAYDAVNKKKVLLELAAYFLNQISVMWGRPVCAELRDFINWISLHIPIKAPTQVKQMPDRAYPLDIVPAYRSTPEDICFDPNLVKRWALNFANRLSEKEKSVFILRHGQGLSLKNIAKTLGYKGSSGPKYPLDRAERKLQFFLRDLPWLSPDDLNKEAFSLFRDTLLGQLSVVGCQLTVDSCQLPVATDNGPRTTDHR